MSLGDLHRKREEVFDEMNRALNKYGDVDRSSSQYPAVENIMRGLVEKLEAVNATIDHEDRRTQAQVQPSETTRSSSYVPQAQQAQNEPGIADENAIRLPRIRSVRDDDYDYEEERRRRYLGEQERLAQRARNHERYHQREHTPHDERCPYNRGY